MNKVTIFLCLILLIFFFGRFRYNVQRGPYHWRLLSYYGGQTEVNQLLTKTHANVMTVLKHMKNKYDDPNSQAYKCTMAIINNYNPDSLYENDPIFGIGTSYTINKGKRMYLCMRQSSDPRQIVDLNTMTFVILHELSHIGNYSDWGHKDNFWSVFKFVLQNAVECQVYDIVDYNKQPIRYCGMMINYQPLFDNNLTMIY